MTTWLLQEMLYLVIPLYSWISENLYDKRIQERENEEVHN